MSKDLFDIDVSDWGLKDDVYTARVAIRLKPGVKLVFEPGPCKTIVWQGDTWFAMPKIIAYLPEEKR